MFKSQEISYKVQISASLDKYGSVKLLFPHGKICLWREAKPLLDEHRVLQVPLLLLFPFTCPATNRHLTLQLQ